MTNGLATRPPQTLVTADQIDLIKRTVAKDATADELQLYLYDCQRQGVHPLDKLIHFTKRSGKYTPITSIDFMRIRAADTGEYAGSDDAAYEIDDSETLHPQMASVTVWRVVNGQRCAFTASARWLEYKPDMNDFMWRKMPFLMLAKCAEALALRKGFPRQLAGLYASEEMDQADRGGYVVHAPDPDPPVSSMTGAGTFAPRDAVSRESSSVPNDPASGRLTVVRVEKAPTKNPKVFKYSITLSSGEVVTTIKERLATLAEQCCQDETPITVETVATKWGTDLLALHMIEHRPPDVVEDYSDDAKEIF